MLKRGKMKNSEILKRLWNLCLVHFIIINRIIFCNEDSSFYVSKYSVCLHSQFLPALKLPQNILPSSVNATSSCLPSWEANSCQSRRHFSASDLVNFIIIEIFIENLYTQVSCDVLKRSQTCSQLSQN